MQAWVFPLESACLHHKPYQRNFASADFRSCQISWSFSESLRVFVRNFGEVSREQLKDEIRRTSIWLLLHNTERTASKFTCRKRKDNVSVGFTYPIKPAREIRHFHVTVCRCSALTAEKCTMKRRDTLAKLLFLPSLQNRRLQDICVLMYKAKNNLCPPYISDIFIKHRSKYNLRQSDFSAARYNTVTYGKHSLRHLGPNLWGKLSQTWEKLPP